MPRREGVDLAHSREVTVQGRRHCLPVPMKFGQSYWDWEVVDFRTPERGDYFVFGDKVQLAAEGMTGEHLVVRPTKHMRLTSLWVYAKPVG